jgi:hypothetical protein
VRDVYDAFLAGLDRFERYGRALGLKRKSKPVASPLDYIRGKAEDLG